MGTPANSLSPLPLAFHKKNIWPFMMTFRETICLFVNSVVQMRIGNLLF